MDSSNIPIHLKNLINGILTGEPDIFLLNGLIKLLFILDKEIVVSKSDLINRIRIPSEDFIKVLNYAVKNELIQYLLVKDELLFSLSHKGNRFYKEKIRTLFFKKDFPNNSNYNDDNIPSFIGCFIADKQGKTLLIFELFDGALKYYLNTKIESEENHRELKLEMELIPMFVSALEKFSKNINIKDLSGLKLKGQNIKLQIFSYDQLTVTCFINPSVNLKFIKGKVREYFKRLFEQYKKELELSINTGCMENIAHLSNLGREMLKELNKFVYLAEFNNLITNLKEFDMSYAKTMYSKLNNLYDDLNLKFTLTLEKINQLRSYLVKAMFDEDLDELKKIIKLTQEIKSKMS